MKHTLLAFTLLALCALGGCAPRFACEMSYYDVEYSPRKPGDAGWYLLKISRSGLVTMKTPEGLATARAGEHFVTPKGEQLQRLRSVDTKTGVVIVEHVLFAM